ncbi:MAG: HAMP domain-containing histidine kinase [Planctomycetia bacterium]|nr:HAMP domain-containing histidine kinase [Planctomycetia bacterium]
MLSRLTERLRATSLRTRLTIWNAAVVLLMTSATLVAVRVAAKSVLYADTDAELRAAAREVVLAIRDLDESAVVAEMRRKAESHEERGWFMHLLTEDGRSVWTSDHCPEAVAAFPPAKLDREENTVQLGQYRYLRLRIPRAGQPAYHVRLGTYTTGLDESLSGLLRILLTVGGGLSLLTPLMAYWLAVRATRPVANILRTAELLKPTRLGDRLLVRGTQDELDRLSQTINGLLDSVATHVDRQEQFVADAAHELRGPLAALQSSLEVAVSQGDAAPERQETLTDILEAARHLAKITNDLLILAETGADGAPVNLDAQDITAIAVQSTGMFAGAAEDKGVSLTLLAGKSVMAPGKADDFRRVASNLLDNAIRFTPAGGRVEVRVAEAPITGDAVLTVTDTGVGIAAQDLAHIFDRFYKADHARSHGGTARSGGLGLAICKSIIESYGGTIVMASRVAEGTTVTVRLPAPPQAGRPRSPPQPPQPAASAGSRPAQPTASGMADSVSFRQL